MNILLFERLSLNITLIITVAYLLSKTGLFNRTIKGIASFSEKVILIIFFGCVGIIGTFIGFPIAGALANTRVVGVVAGGLLGGPAIGLVAGIIAGGHRFYLGGATGLSCGIATVINGLLAGYVAKRFAPYKLNLKYTIVIGVVTNIIEMN